MRDSPGCLAETGGWGMVMSFMGRRGKKLLREGGPIGASLGSSFRPARAKDGGWWGTLAPRVVQSCLCRGPVRALSDFFLSATQRLRIATVSPALSRFTSPSPLTVYTPSRPYPTTPQWLEVCLAPSEALDPSSWGQFPVWSSCHHCLAGLLQSDTQQYLTALATRRALWQVLGTCRNHKRPWL